VKDVSQTQLPHDRHLRIIERKCFSVLSHPEPSSGLETLRGCLNNLSDKIKDNQDLLRTLSSFDGLLEETRNEFSLEAVHDTYQLFGGLSESIHIFRDSRVRTLDVLSHQQVEVD
jgi:hypothetical protein